MALELLSSAMPAAIVEEADVFMAPDQVINYRFPKNS
jgi:hypothetical protein